MKTALFRAPVLVISSIALAMLGFSLLPADNLLSDVLADNPSWRIGIIALIAAGYLVMYLVTVAVTSFLGSLFCKLATKDKESFDLKKAKDVNKTAITLLIALHVACFALQTVTHFAAYAAVFFAVGLAIIFLVMGLYKRKDNPSLNLFVAALPLIVYVFGSLVYGYLTF